MHQESNHQPMHQETTHQRIHQCIHQESPCTKSQTHAPRDKSPTHALIERNHQPMHQESNHQPMHQESNHQPMHHESNHHLVISLPQCRKTRTRAKPWEVLLTPLVSRWSRNTTHSLRRTKQSRRILLTPLVSGEAAHGWLCICCHDPEEWYTNRPVNVLYREKRYVLIITESNAASFSICQRLV